MEFDREILTPENGSIDLSKINLVHLWCWLHECTYAQNLAIHRKRRWRFAFCKVRARDMARSSTNGWDNITPDNSIIKQQTHLKLDERNDVFRLCTYFVHNNVSHGAIVVITSARMGEADRSEVCIRCDDAANFPQILCLVNGAIDFDSLNAPSSSSLPSPVLVVVAIMMASARSVLCHWISKSNSARAYGSKIKLIQIFNSETHARQLQSIKKR